MYPWLLPSSQINHRYGNYDQIKHNYLIEDYLKDSKDQGITSSIYMEAEWDPTNPTGETKYISGIAKNNNIIGAMVAQAWLDASNINELLTKQSSYSIVRSVRHKPRGPISPEEVGSGYQLLITDSNWLNGDALLENFGLHFELRAPWWNLYETSHLAKNIPNTLLIINHSGVIFDRNKSTISQWKIVRHFREPLTSISLQILNAYNIKLITTFTWRVCVDSISLINTISKSDFLITRSIISVITGPMPPVCK